MKKIIGVVVGLAGLTLLTGCGDSGKKLTCTYDFGTTDPTTTLEYILTFDADGNQVESYVERWTATYVNITDDEFAEEYSDAQDTCVEFEDMAGVTCDVTKSDKSITLERNVTISKLDDAAKEELATEYMEDISYDEFKEGMEEVGYTCK